jgi:hypothetical protein
MSQLDQLLAGDDDEVGYNEIGAGRARGGGGGARPKGARAPGSTPRSGPTANLRKVFVGVPVEDVGIGATKDINCPVLEPFRLDLPILSKDAQAMGVLNIRVGTKPLNVSNNPCAGNVFGDFGVALLSGYTATPGTGITLTLVNNTAAIVKSGGGFLGWAAL